ncbi:hypothetical protein GCM10010156_42310 [Planobispora rosea]|uniref:Secreted protein n=1 Tax=Planobispora rosea TaxID=35762 RepID=A0A8J3S2Q7_PLARO|nr:hypothetical protein [Planobispora rosea]GGS79073.1 hypothetical protein GCM10010156_42310 [Planobispora rosea]GIH85755.1 hypothetical protein Pro02_41630 [Planobispora rosea]
MFRLISSRRIAVTVAGAALLSLTAACGAGANSSICSEAPWTKLTQEYTTAVTGAGGDLNKYNEANQKFASDLKKLAGEAEGDLATALNNFATAIGNVKIDANDPTSATAAVQELGTKTQELQSELVKACS